MISSQRPWPLDHEAGQILESNRSNLFKVLSNVYRKNYTKYLNELFGKRGYSRRYIQLPMHFESLSQ